MIRGDINCWIIRMTSRRERTDDDHAIQRIVMRTWTWRTPKALGGGRKHRDFFSVLFLSPTSTSIDTLPTNITNAKRGVSSSSLLLFVSFFRLSQQSIVHCIISNFHSQIHGVLFDYRDIFSFFSHQWHWISVLALWPVSPAP